MDLQVHQVSILKLIPIEHRIRAAMDTSTLIRLFYSSWKSPEFKLYQNIFDIVIPSTAYKEFLNYQRGSPRSVRHKDSFIALIGGQIIPSRTNLSQGEDFDYEIIDETAANHILMIITDNVKDFRDRCAESGIYYLDGLKLRKLFHEN